MDAVTGDRIVVDSVKIGSPRRSGEVVEVIGITDQHYRVRWDDGHETVLFPSSNTRVVPTEPSS